MARGLNIRLSGVGWQRFRARINQGQVLAKEMASARFLIGSTKPYATHWIEEGYRDDPRFGRVTVNYRQPSDTQFMYASAVAFRANFRRRRPEKGAFGAVLGARAMHQWANSIADSMRIILQAQVYSTPVPTGVRGRPKWQRTHKLYNSIRAYRV